MDYSELLFAAAVRELAVSLRISARLEYKDTLPDDENAYQRELAWLRAHKVNDFVPEALECIKETAAIIRANA